VLVLVVIVLAAHKLADATSLKKILSILFVEAQADGGARGAFSTMCPPETLPIGFADARAQLASRICAWSSSSPSEVHMPSKDIAPLIGAHNDVGGQNWAVRRKQYGKTV
jgi:hypothetical protein